MKISLKFKDGTWKVKNGKENTRGGRQKKFVVFCSLLITFYLLLVVTVNAGEINTLYKDAMDAFYKKNYTEAISMWEQVLKIDPNQKPPVKLINIARSKILEGSNSLNSEYNQFLNDGNYEIAADKLKKLLETDPTNPKWNMQKEKLGRFMANVAPSITGAGKIPTLLRKSVNGYLGNEKDDRIAVLASRYAWQIDKANNITSKVFIFMDREFTEIARLEVMDNTKNVVEQKLDAMLEAIRAGKSDYAAMEGELVIALEPENMLALKLLGSAYYTQGKIGQARNAWEKALKISPNDPEIKKFLPKVKR